MKWLRRGVLLLVVAVSAVYVALGARTPWDFEIYYYAGRAVRVGLDPYDPSSLGAVAGKMFELPFVYPPAALLLFGPLSHLPVGAAGYLWLGVQCLLALALFLLWRKYFLPEVPPDLLLVVTLLGFNAALLWALRTGNLAVLEAALLWGGFAALARGRLAVAGALIALGGVFKLLPLAFLALVAAAPGAARDRARALLAAALVLAATLLLGGPLLPGWAAGVARAITLHRPTGEVNPTLFGLLDGWVSGAGWNEGAARWLVPAICAAFGAAVLAFSARPFARLRREGRPADWILFAVLVWLLLSPRVMVYSWVVAVAPAIHVIRTRLRPGPLRPAAYGLLLLQGMARFLPGPPPKALAGLSFLLLAGLWGLAVAAPAGRSAEPELPARHGKVGDP